MQVSIIYAGLKDLQGASSVLKAASNTDSQKLYAAKEKSNSLPHSVGTQKASGADHVVRVSKQESLCDNNGSNLVACRNEDPRYS